MVNLFQNSESAKSVRPEYHFDWYSFVVECHLVEWPYLA